MCGLETGQRGIFMLLPGRAAMAAKVFNSPCAAVCTTIFSKSAIIISITALPHLIIVPLCALMQLPQELRDTIYSDYADDNGYHFENASNKLRTASNALINLSLVFTCRQVATEMRGFALRINAITFTAVHSEDSNSRADRFRHI